MNMLLKQLLKAFEMVKRCYEGEGGASGGTIDDGTIVEDTTEIEEIEFNAETYMGSKEINPTQRPLKDFDREGKSQKEIDSFIENAGPSIYLSDEAIAKKKEADEKKGKEEPALEVEKEVNYKADKDSEEEKAVITKVNDDETFTIKVGDKEIENVTKESLKAIKAKEKDDTTGDEEDPETKAFYEAAKLTPEEFNGLSEKAQENLVNKIYASGETKGEEKTLQEKLNILQKDYDNIINEPTVAAVIAEKTTGHKFVANKVEPFTDQEIAEIDSLYDGTESTAKVRKKLDEIFQKRVEAAVRKERSVQETNQQAKVNTKEAWKVLKEVGGLDKRLAVKETDHKKLVPGHPEFNPEKGLGEFATYLKEKEYSTTQIKAIGAKELYASFAKHKGWDAERDQTIFKSGAKKLLDKLKNPKLVGKAKSLQQGKKQTAPGGLKVASGVDYKTLKQELVSGNSKNYLRLLKAHEHNPKVRKILSQIQYDADVERQRLESNK